ARRCGRARAAGDTRTVTPGGAAGRAGLDRPSHGFILGRLGEPANRPDRLALLSLCPGPPPLTARRPRLAARGRGAARLAGLAPGGAPFAPARAGRALGARARPCRVVGVPLSRQGGGEALR